MINENSGSIDDGGVAVSLFHAIHKFSAIISLLLGIGRWVIANAKVGL
jgi:hypothetical protein